MAEWSKAVDSSYFEFLQRLSLVIPTYPGFESQFYQNFLYLKYRNLRSFFFIKSNPTREAFVHVVVVFVPSSGDSLCSTSSICWHYG